MNLTVLALALALVTKTTSLGVGVQVVHPCGKSPKCPSLQAQAATSEIKAGGAQATALHIRITFDGPVRTINY